MIVAAIQIFIGLFVYIHTTWINSSAPTSQCSRSVSTFHSILKWIQKSITIISIILVVLIWLLWNQNIQIITRISSYFPFLFLHLPLIQLVLDDWLLVNGTFAFDNNIELISFISLPKYRGFWRKGFNFDFFYSL